MGRNSKLFSVGGCEKVDIETGESVPVEGGGLRMLPGPPGTCEWCHVEHDPTHPHNQQLLPYQMKFHTIHGRWPTWTDAMAHCPPEIRAYWRSELVKLMERKGLPIPADLQSDCPKCGGSGGGPDPALACGECGGTGRNNRSVR